MANGFGSLPSFASSDDQGAVSPAIQAWIQDQRLQAQYEPQATAPGFTGYNAPTAPAAADPNKVLTPLGQKWAGDLKDVVTAPQRAYTGELQVWDPATGHTTDAARGAAMGLAGLAMTGGFGGVAARQGETVLGSGPFRQIDAGNGFVARAEEFAPGARAYRLHQQAPDGAVSDSSIGHAILNQHPDGRWETGSLLVNPENRGQGGASALYRAIEQDTGQPRVPSGNLLEDGYAFWKARDPEAVQYHQHVGDGVYLSPRRIMELLKQAPTPEDRAMGQALLDQVPAAGKTPEALAKQFLIPGTLAGGAAANALNRDRNGL